MIDDKMSSVRERVASEAALRGDYETANRLYEEYGSRISGGVKNVLTAIPAEELNTFLQYAPEQVRVNF
jgi:hypothetical protein